MQEVEKMKTKALLLVVSLSMLVFGIVSSCGGGGTGGGGAGGGGTGGGGTGGGAPSAQNNPQGTASLAAQSILSSLLGSQYDSIGRPTRSSLLQKSGAIGFSIRQAFYTARIGAQLKKANYSERGDCEDGGTWSFSVIGNDKFTVSYNQCKEDGTITDGTLACSINLQTDESTCSFSNFSFKVYENNYARLVEELTYINFTMTFREQGSEFIYRVSGTIRTVDYSEGSPQTYEAIFSNYTMRESLGSDGYYRLIIQGSVEERYNNEYVRAEYTNYELRTKEEGDFYLLRVNGTVRFDSNIQRCVSDTLNFSTKQELKCELSGICIQGHIVINNNIHLIYSQTGAIDVCVDSNNNNQCDSNEVILDDRSFEQIDNICHFSPF